MPKPRKEINQGLPARWRVQHGAYYYQVPLGHERFWEFKQLYRLGKTLDEALEKFRDVGSRIQVDDIPLAKLHSAHHIRTFAQPFVRCGVYFLLKLGKVVYVGRSINIAARIAQHVDDGRIDFDDTFAVEAAEGFEMERLEQLYIALLIPPYNVKHTCGMVRDAVKGTAT